MKWAQSLIRITEFEVEGLQKRLREIADRRVAIELVIAALEAEAEAETRSARANAEAGWYLVGFREGWKIRRAKVEADLQACEMEEAGVRDALGEAFETQKKYEQVLEAALKAQAAEAARRENAALDEVALRQGTRR
jgi:flagellar FliJ protein